MRVTVGIPFLNASATLADAIRSVFAQSYSDWELILVDDGSRDGSLELARSIRDPRVRVISDGMNRRVAYRHNQIAAAARGDYIAKLDDDDIMHPERLRRQVEYMDANPSVDIVGTSVYTMTLDGTVSGSKLQSNRTLTQKIIVARSQFIQGSSLGKTEWFRKHPYDTGYVRSEDHELWARTFPTSTFRVLEEPLTYVREGRTRTIRKYVTSKRSDRRIFMKYGPAVAGWPETLRWTLVSYVKSIAYCTLWSCGMNGFALRHSWTDLDPACVAEAQAILVRVLRTTVAGLPPRLGVTAVHPGRVAL